MGGGGPPGEAVAPGVVLLMRGVAVAVLGVVLIVLVLRMLLALAVTRDAEASRLKAGLDKAI
ncbi:DUF2975 domain-containing protein [Streptomyces kanamyceticus]|uniref:DUF2975 domain-containing protein n=1 Tax=Streptomyces kanamyceticus TaxID=1967 RepID=UPI0037DC6900